MVLVWVLVALLIISGIVFAGIQSQQALERSTRFETSDPAHARAVATAGIVDAFAWFRRQSVQPVSTFGPRRDMAATPPVNETDNAAIGLVREYEIAPSLWGRYEVRLTRDAETFTDSNGNGYFDTGEPYSDADGNGKWDDAQEVQDISAQRGLPGSGGVWRIVSHGFLYKRPRVDLPLDTSPNDRLAAAMMASEIRRLNISPPASAALCVDRGDNIQIGNRGRIAGASGAGVAFASGTGSPVFNTGSEVSGSPTSSPQPGYDASIEGVFGVSISELKSMADASTSDPSSVPEPVGEFTLTVIEGDITFDATRALRGTGVVVVLGDCTISSGSNSFFSGLLWVQGDLTVQAPAYLRGIFIARGAVDVRGIGGDYAEINHDDAILTELLFLMGQYRHTKTVFQAGGDPKSIAATGGA